MAILNDEADAGEVFRRLRAEMSFCTGVGGCKTQCGGQGSLGVRVKWHVRIVLVIGS